MRRVARVVGVVVITWVLLLTGASAAFADWPDEPSCVYVPDDIYGYKFNFYCWEVPEGGAVGKNGERHVNNDKAATGNVLHWKEPDEKKNPHWTNGGIGTDCANKWDMGEWNVDKDSPRGKQLYQEQCVGKRMDSWLDGRHGDSDLSNLEDPCTTLPKEVADQCVNPIGNNPCLAIPVPDELAASTRAKCMSDHPEFRQKFAGDPGNGLPGCGGDDCGKDKSESASGIGVDDDVIQEMRDLLGYGVFGALCVSLVALMVTGAQLALARRGGKDVSARAVKVVWVCVAVFLIGTVSSVAVVITGMAGK
ncbi:hypothetical protein LO772_32110 [Yinghuangia sp. ASG 101]|uniref:hypothetical protein n=1 Tax=Yinghuangia sp. ASG 101 TaxID=2896848 RepID=UPI001E5A8669|nr:hypothetical protein [Yinghuangia sp. ASG 101]UGQ11387.1 hypothetical protein LO772_32110 [Yinghuangia sp. ASG 101]